MIAGLAGGSAGLGGSGQNALKVQTEAGECFAGLAGAQEVLRAWAEADRMLCSSEQKGYDLMELIVLLLLAFFCAVAFIQYMKREQVKAGAFDQSIKQLISHYKVLRESVGDVGTNAFVISYAQEKHKDELQNRPNALAVRILDEKGARRDGAAALGMEVLELSGRYFYQFPVELENELSGVEMNALLPRIKGKLDRRYPDDLVSLADGYLTVVVDGKKLLSLVGKRAGAAGKQARENDLAAAQKELRETLRRTEKRHLQGKAATGSGQDVVTNDGDGEKRHLQGKAATGSGQDAVTNDGDGEKRHLQGKETTGLGQNAVTNDGDTEKRHLQGKETTGPGQNAVTNDGDTEKRHAKESDLEDDNKQIAVKGDSCYMERVNFGPKPFMYPQPVLIIGTYDENGVPNAMNAAWGITTDFAEITISLSEHKTTDNFAVTGAFTVSIATEEFATACDYVGIESARKVPDKFERAGFHAVKSPFVDAPLIKELPMALECRVKSFSDGILVGEIVNVCADESVITDGKVDVEKLRPIAFDPMGNAYWGVGRKVGNAFKDGLRLK